MLHSVYKNELDLLCIGNAMADIFANGDAQELIRHGISKPVQHIETGKLTQILSGIHDYTVVSGGGAANVAKIAGFLGARVGFTGSIGVQAKHAQSEMSGEPDRFGQLFKKDLEAAGVELGLSLKPLPTGICLYFRTDEGVIVAASPEAAHELSESDINEEDIKKAALVVIDGFMLGRPGLVRHILCLADKYGKKTALDLSSASIAGGYAKEIMEYSNRYPLILFMNEAEAVAWYQAAASHKGPMDKVCGTSGKNTPLEEALSFYKSLTSGRPFPLIVVKLGRRGAAALAGGEIYRAETEPITPKESTGAGDAFCAAFLLAWARNRPVSECAAFGNRAARKILDETGTKGDSKKFKDLAESLSDFTR